MTYPYPGIDTYDQPLVDAWWTPGWTAQNQAYRPAPQTLYATSGPTYTYVNVTGRYYDLDNSPLGGFLSFMPSDSATLTSGSTTWRLPQRLTGTMLPVTSWDGGPGFAFSQAGSGRVYIVDGLMACALMPTDISGLVTDGGLPLTYLVTEHMLGGRQFSISVPSASPNPVDINSLIVAGSVAPYPYDAVFPLGVQAEPQQPATIPTFIQTIPYGSTEYVNVDVSLAVPGLGNVNPTADAVFMAFLTSTGSPQISDWVTATWTTQSPPYTASVLIGPGNGGLNLPMGSYYVWVKIVDNPEIPFVQAGSLVIS